jgi:Cu/Ag efflux pump CusA
VGVLLALLVTGSTINMFSIIGVILLMGLVTKNAILLVDLIQRSVTGGKDRKSAIIEAGGIVSSTLLTLVIVPALYTYLDDLGNLRQEHESGARRARPSPAMGRAAAPTGKLATRAGHAERWD